jgi:hemolysin activation/secretion protein
VLENNVITAISDPGEPEFDYATLYDSISGSQASFQLSGKIGWFQPLGARSVVHVGWQGGLLQGGLLLQNELFRLGGYRRLRGFDEESIFANHFHIATIEYRFLLGQNSRFAIFGDLAWLEEQRLGLNRRDTPYGFGAGLDFETSAGIFGLSYALGSQRGNPIAFREAKIHFGYVNRF